MMEDTSTPAALVQRCQDIWAHAWMVRTFVKHSSEVEDFPELMQIARMVFDASRSLESRIDDPPAYFRQMKKKLRKLRAAAEQFAHDAPLASDHTNFRQAVISMNACVGGLERLTQEFDSISGQVLQNPQESGHELDEPASDHHDQADETLPNSTDPPLSPA